MLLTFAGGSHALWRVCDDRERTRRGRMACQGHNAGQEMLMMSASGKAAAGTGCLVSCGSSVALRLCVGQRSNNQPKNSRGRQSVQAEERPSDVK